MIFTVTLLLAVTVGNFVDITCNDLFTKKIPVVLPDDLNRASSCDFPESFEVQLQSQQPFRVAFTLKRNDLIDIDAPVYVLKHASRDVAFIPQPEVQVKRTAAYQSSAFGAYFLVRCKEHGYELEGTIYLDGRKYRLAPSQNGGATVDTVSKVSWYDVTEVKDMLQMDVSINRPVVGGSAQWLEQGVDTGRVLRRKRASAKTEYYLDIIVATDYSFYKYWLNRANNVETTALTSMKEYIAYIFNGINARYKSITSLPFNINIVLRGYIIAKNPSDSPWTELIKETNSDRVQVNAITMLARLQDYVNKTNPSCDHVVGFTEYDLYSEDSGFRFNNTAGFAHVGAMCYPNGLSVSVVEDHGGYQSETAATHELGHSLGALHDGNENNCSSADRYIMSPGSELENDANKYNPWHFSSCSVQYFQNFVNKLIAENSLNNLVNTCLKQKLGQQDVPSVNGLPGYLHGPDEQCRQIYGNASYLCRGAAFNTNSEDICVEMYCHQPDTNVSCALTTAAQGTCCNTGKWCIDGQCVKSSNATSCYMSASCPFGQRQGVVFQGRTCDEMESGVCYDSINRVICCEMCDKQRRNITDCEYGDRDIGCRSDNCGTSELKVRCCETCSYKSSPSTLRTTAPPKSNPSVTTLVALPTVTCRVIPGLEPICAAGCIIQSFFTTAVFTVVVKLLSTYASL